VPLMMEFETGVLYQIFFVVSVIFGIALGHWSVTGHVFGLPTSIDAGWASLIGAFTGAATPVSIFLWQEKRREKQKEKDFFLFVEKSLV
jgi:hypothetical protein